MSQDNAIEIPVSGSGRQALVSPADAGLAAYSWRLDNFGRPSRDITARGADGCRRNKRQFLGRVVTGAAAGDLVRHKDGDPLNCQRHNLVLDHDPVPSGTRGWHGPRPGGQPEVRRQWEIRNGFRDE